MPGTWWKYRDGRWDEPGLGGLATRILGEDVGGGAMSASYNDYLGRYLLVFLYETGDEREGIYFMTSADGVTGWSEPLLLVRGPTSPGNRLWLNFPSMIGIGKSSTHETSRENWLFYMHGGPDGSRALARRRVSIQ